MAAADVSDRNAAFWDELCGSHLAREIGVSDASPESLARFDEAYLAIYPYLLGYFPPATVQGRRLLEIGLGYGTLGEALARRGADYHGLDIAAGPVRMMQARLARIEGAKPEQVVQGSALAMPFADASFDEVVAIGCLHHTGDLFGSLAEVRRVLRPGGRLVMMVYNRRSLRRAMARRAMPWHAVPTGTAPTRRCARATTHRRAAPRPRIPTSSRVAELRGLLHGFGSVRIDRRNMDPLPVPRVAAPHARGDDALADRPPGRARSLRGGGGVSGSPRFSVVVPTRDRPDLLEFCLAGLAAQSAPDFEVIVSDNATTAPAREVFDRHARPGWRYVQPREPVAMHDNFERAVSEAGGDYVAVVIDKTILHPSAIEIAGAALAAQPADIVTWQNEGYDPVDEAHDLAVGRYRPTIATSAPTLYDPVAELAARFANAERRGVDPVHYARGKIVFGAFSRTLLDRIRDRTGRVFHPLAPDYTSMVPACVLADGALDVGRPLLVSYNSARSNGRRQGVDPAHALRFIEIADRAIVDALPIAGLYTSVHNVVAYDLVSAAARLPAGSTPPLNLANLVRRAREDLDGVVWTDAAEREAQLTILDEAERRHGIDRGASTAAASRSARDRAASLLARVPPLERLAIRATGGTVTATFASPLEAARAADRHYSRLGVPA